MTTMQAHVLDVIERAVKTFVAAFIPIWAASSFSTHRDILLAAAAAAISVGWNVSIKVNQAIQAHSSTTQ